MSATSTGTALAWLPTPIGALLVETDDEAVLRIWLPGRAPLDAPPGPRCGPAVLTPGVQPGVLNAALDQLSGYFAGVRRDFDVPVRLRGTPFQVAVWEQLAAIPYGEVWSYGELARAVGRPGAFRAVGQANGANPLPIVRPCHRVVASGGGIGGYGGGLAMKRALLELEGAPALR